MKKINIDSSKILPIAIFGLGILTSVLSNKNQANERNALKNELKEEIMKDLSSNNN